MNATEIYGQLQQITWVEVAGFATSLAGVWLAAREKVLTWPVSLAGVVLSLVVFYQARLYADVVLQVFYLGITLYGWYQWKFGGNQQTELPITRATLPVLAAALVAGAVLSPVAGYLFSRYTDAALPYYDSALAVFSVLTTWLMARKILQHWLLWIVIDLCYAHLFFIKGLYLYSLLYLLFTVLAVFGYREWKQKLKPLSGA